MVWRRRRRDWDDIFDIFGREFEIFDEIFDRMIRDFEEMFRRAERGEIKPIIRGFSIRIGPDGKPEIKEFGTKSEKIIKEGIEERKPLIDVIETDDEVQVIAEMPGVNKEDIDLSASEKSLEIRAEGENRRYYEVVDLPCEVIPESAKARYNNGVLEVVLKKKYPSSKEKKKIRIE